MRKIIFPLIGACLLWPAFLPAQRRPGEPFDFNRLVLEGYSVDTNVTETAAPPDEFLDPEQSFLIEVAEQYQSEGNYEEAERAYLRALEDAPDEPRLVFSLGTLYLTMNRNKEGAEWLQKAVRLAPDNAQAHNNLAWAYATAPVVRNHKKALWHAREALLLSPGLPSVWNTLAEAYYVAGNYQKALRAAEYAVGLLKAINDETRLEDYQRQQMKIKRALDSFRQFEGLDSEDF